MKKLIKISDYYYVVNDKSKIKSFNWVIKDNLLFKVTNQNYPIHKDKMKIICSNNPSLSLPQIINASDELVGKEIEIEFISKCPNNDCNDTYFPHIDNKNGTTTCKKCLHSDFTEFFKIAILKPISKETISDEKLNDFTDENDFNNKELVDSADKLSDLMDEIFDEEETSNETLDTELRTHPNREFCLSYLRAKQLNIVDEWKTWQLTSDIVKTNETLEEIAQLASEKYQYTRMFDNIDEETCAIDGYYKGFIAGYKHCKKTMYSKDEAINLCFKVYEESEEISEFLQFNNPKEWLETFKNLWFNNNKK